MLRALYTGASGMSAQEMNLENVANNLANSSTAGFRKRRLQFEDLIYQNVVMPGAASTQQTTVATGLQIGLGARSAASEIVQTQGDFSRTGNALDLAIQGQGFFQITLPSGETAYTRSGAFHLDSSGNVVTSDGNPMDPAITIPPNATSVTIGSDGTVSVTTPGQTQAQQVGTMQLAIFQNPGGLNSVGNNLFLATAASMGQEARHKGAAPARSQEPYSPPRLPELLFCCRLVVESFWRPPEAESDKQKDMSIDRR